MGKTFTSPAICFLSDHGVSSSRSHPKFSDCGRRNVKMADKVTGIRMEVLFCICFDFMNLRHDRFFSLDRMSWKGTESVSLDGGFFKKTVSCKQVCMAVFPFDRSVCQSRDLIHAHFLGSNLHEFCEQDVKRVRDDDLWLSRFLQARRQEVKDALPALVS